MIVGSRPRAAAPVGAVPAMYGLSLAYAAVGQGGQFARAFGVFLLLNLVVLLVLVGRRAPVRAVVTSVAPLVLVALVQLGWHGLSWGPIRLLGLVVIGGVGVIVGRSVETREVLWWVRAVGVGFAALALFGLFVHMSPLAVERSGMWRAAGPLTYPNVAATVIGVGTLVGLWFLARDGSWGGRVAVLVQSTALVATFSRGGILAFGLATGVLALRSGAARRAIRELAPWLLVAVVGLLPASGGGDAWLVALGGALVVAAAAGFAYGLRPQVWAWAPVVGGGLAIGWSAGVLSSRLTLLDQGRLTLWGRAVDVWANQPLLGTGLGRLDLDIGPPSYAHNEYLQWLAEAGLVGLVALAATAFLLVRLLAAGGPGPRRLPLMAAIGAIALQGAVDFVLHVPLVVALLGVLLGAASRRSPDSLQPAPGERMRVIQNRMGTARRFQ